jgi:hypothetical protein
VTLALRPAREAAAPPALPTLRPPVAGDGVPLSMLKGIKRVFDPEGRLAAPPWLETIP